MCRFCTKGIVPLISNYAFIPKGKIYVFLFFFFLIKKISSIYLPCHNGPISPCMFCLMMQRSILISSNIIFPFLGIFFFFFQIRVGDKTPTQDHTKGSGANRPAKRLIFENNDILEKYSKYIGILNNKQTELKTWHSRVAIRASLKRQKRFEIM